MAADRPEAREGCPRITIVMAVYKPREDWLREQLRSLNAQDYPNLELIACDDCPEAPMEEAPFREEITAFPWKLIRNERNIGSNKTFERLTALAPGQYIAYCDQDDVWLPHKLLSLWKLLQDGASVLACSDAAVIDAEGKETAASITQVRRRHVFEGGEGLAPRLLYRNFVMGCTMLLPAALAKAALPFPEHMVHDHWLALWASRQGGIAVAGQPLIRYRIHGANQTMVLAMVAGKQDYVNARVLPFCQRMREIHSRVDLGAAQREAEEWAAARVDNACRKPGAALQLYRKRRPNQAVSWFELIALRLPDGLFRLLIRLVRSGIL